MDDQPTLIGTRVRRRRIELGMTQDQLALAAGTTRQLISRLEKGNLDISLRRLTEVSRALGLRIELRDPARASRSLIPESTLAALSTLAASRMKIDTESLSSISDAARQSIRGLASDPAVRAAAQRSAPGLVEAVPPAETE